MLLVFVVASWRRGLLRVAAIELALLSMRAMPGDESCRCCRFVLAAVAMPDESCLVSGPALRSASTFKLLCVSPLQGLLSESNLCV